MHRFDQDFFLFFLFFFFSPLTRVYAVTFGRFRTQVLWRKRTKAQEERCYGVPTNPKIPSARGKKKKSLGSNSFLSWTFHRRWMSVRLAFSFADPLSVEEVTLTEVTVYDFAFFLTFLVSCYSMSCTVCTFVQSMTRATIHLKF